jgi:hypothetical protein
MVAGTSGTGEGPIGNTGLVYGHAYSLLKAKEI